VMKRNCDLVTRATSSVDPSAMAAKPLWQMMARKMPSCYATAQRHDTSNQGGDRGVNGTVARLSGWNQANPMEWPSCVIDCSTYLF
jgi:hypothetical protein